MACGQRRALYFEKAVRGFSRYDKYTLGADLRNLSREVLRLIQRANSEEDRVETLREIRSKVEELKTVLRLARESGAISRANSYEFAAGKVVNIGRHCAFGNASGGGGVARLARLKLIRRRRAGYRGWARLPVDRFPYLLDAARRAGVTRIVIVREAGAGPVIPRIPAAVGRIVVGRGLLEEEELTRI